MSGREKFKHVDKTRYLVDAIHSQNALRVEREQCIQCYEATRVMFELVILIVRVVMYLTMNTDYAQEADTILTRSTATQEADQSDEAANSDEYERQSVERYQRSDHGHSVEQLPVEGRISIGGVHEKTDCHHSKPTNLLNANKIK